MNSKLYSLFLYGCLLDRKTTQVTEYEAITLGIIFFTHSSYGLQLEAEKFDDLLFVKT
jgi:hypothetical protein